MGKIDAIAGAGRMVEKIIWKIIGIWGCKAGYTRYTLNTGKQPGPQTGAKAMMTAVKPVYNRSQKNYEIKVETIDTNGGVNLAAYAMAGFYIFDDGVKALEAIWAGRGPSDWNEAKRETVRKWMEIKYAFGSAK